MTPQQKDNWDAIVTLLKRDKYKYVHKMYSSSGGWGYITGVMGRTEIGYASGYKEVYSLLEIEHDALPKKLQCI